MPQLAVNYSPHLRDLIRENKIRLDAVELTPWQKVFALPQILQEISGFTLYYHGSNLTARSLLPGARSQLAESLRLTQARWFSTHISLLPPGWVWLALRFGIHLPAPPAEWLLSNFLRRVERLKKEHPGIPLLLENMPTEPRSIHKHLKTPLMIREVIEKTGCGLLLDLPHSRIAAEAFGMETSVYLSQLPLERVVEIHTSGPGRMQDGTLQDQHWRLQAEDYHLLDWALAHTPVQLVTLEYIQDREGLEEQLPELARRICP